VEARVAETHNADIRITTESMSFKLPAHTCMMMLLFRLGRGIQHDNGSPLRILADDARYPVIIKLNVNLEDAILVMAQVFPKLLVIHGTAVSVICHAVRRSQQFFDLFSGCVSDLNFGDVGEIDAGSSVCLQSLCRREGVSMP
jgi:hypothetical protein